MKNDFNTEGTENTGQRSRNQNLNTEVAEDTEEHRGTRRRRRTTQSGSAFSVNLCVLRTTIPPDQRKPRRFLWNTDRTDQTDLRGFFPIRFNTPNPQYPRSILALCAVLCVLCELCVGPFRLRLAASGPLCLISFFSFPKCALWISDSKRK